MREDRFRRVEHQWEINMIKGKNFSEEDKIKIGKSFLEMMNHFYSDPKNEKEFWEWYEKKQGPMQL